MKKLLKLMCLVLALVLIMGAMASCKDTTEEPTNEPTAAQTTKETVEQPAATEDDWANEPVSRPGELPIVDEPVTITAFAELSIATDMDWNEHWFINYLNEQTNVNLEITDFGAEDPKAKKNVILSSGVYPDVFLTRYGAQFSCSEVVKYGQQEGIFINLSPLVEKYGYYLKAEMDARPDYFVSSHALDGNLYAFPIIREDLGNKVNPQAWVNTDWLDALNMDRPVTVDDFVDMLRAFKEQDPGGVGSENVLPWTSNVICRSGAYLLLAYTECDFTGKTFLRTSNDCVEFAASTDEFREGLKVMNQLCEEGLYDPNSFTANWDAGIAASSSGLVGVYENQHIGCMDWEDDETYRKFQVLNPLVGPEGVQNAATVSDYYYSVTFFGAITDACENPEAAFRLIDFFYSEEATLLHEYGEPGVVWDYNDDSALVDANGDARLIKYYNEGPRAQGGQFGTSSTNFNAGPFNQSTELYLKTLNGNLLDTCLTDNSQWGADQVRKYLEGQANARWRYVGLPVDMFMEPAKSEEILTIKPNVQAVTMAGYQGFIVGTRDPNNDDDWAEFLAELEGVEVDKYVDYYQEAYVRWQDGLAKYN